MFLIDLFLSKTGQIPKRYIKRGTKTSKLTKSKMRQILPIPNIGITIITIID